MIFCRINKGQDGIEDKTTKNGQESGLEDELDFDTNLSSTDSEEDSDRLEERFRSMNFERTEIQKLEFVEETVHNEL